MRRFRDDESGLAPAIFLVLMVPLLMTIMVGTIQFTNTVGASDVNIQESTVNAARGSAGAMNTIAQADGLIRINTTLAHDNFQAHLCNSFGLNSDLTPDNEAYSTPEYWLLVYNGYNDYSGCSQAILYHYDKTSLTTADLSGMASGFPATFSVSDAGITVGSGGTHNVTLETPGVIAVIKIDNANVVNKTTTTVLRWASARIVGIGGVFKVI